MLMIYFCLLAFIFAIMTKKIKNLIHESHGQKGNLVILAEFVVDFQTSHSYIAVSQGNSNKLYQSYHLAAQ